MAKLAAAATPGPPGCLSRPTNNTNDTNGITSNSNSNSSSNSNSNSNSNQ